MLHPVTTVQYRYFIKPTSTQLLASQDSNTVPGQQYSGYVLRTRGSTRPTAVDQRPGISRQLRLRTVPVLAGPDDPQPVIVGTQQSVAFGRRRERNRGRQQKGYRSDAHHSISHFTPLSSQESEAF